MELQGRREQAGQELQKQPGQHLVQEGGQQPGLHMSQACLGGEVLQMLVTLAGWGVICRIFATGT